MYCHICGKPLPKGATVCPECGSGVPSVRENRKDSVLEADKSIMTASASAQKEEKEQVRKNDAADAFICPKCGRDNLQVINEVSVHTKTTGSGYSVGKGCCGYIMLGPLGLLCGACNEGPKTETTTENATCFVCSSCGNKFRKPVELREDADRVEENALASAIMFVVAAVLLVIIFAAIGEGSGEMMIAGILLWIVFVCIALVGYHSSKGKAEAMREEANQIERDMRRFR